MLDSGCERRCRQATCTRCGIYLHSCLQSRVQVGQRLKHGQLTLFAAWEPLALVYLFTRQTAQRTGVGYRPNHHSAARAGRSRSKARQLFESASIANDAAFWESSNHVLGNESADREGSLGHSKPKKLDSSFTASTAEREVAVRQVKVWIDDRNWKTEHVQQTYQMAG